MDTGRKRPDGVATTDLVLSAYVGTNAEVFPHVLDLHVPRGSRIADVTWGKGAFWRNVPDDAYEVLATDIQTGVDCRDLPYGDGELDCVVLDPPYMEGLFRKSTGNMAGSGSHAAFRSRYSDSKAVPPDADGPKYHDAVIDLYLKAAVEARRVLRDYGVFVVKCQDEVSANRQRLTHVELINAFESDGFYCKDLFVVVRPNRPGVTRLLTQEHARKNHSYFLVFIKRDPAHPKRVRPPKRDRSGA
ncbi:DNA methyltransferase [Amycolatopsis suaedae]|uniref:Site-specific DNA-methyltransferase n=1 Tax=Amycolatopsis suaedae TaxID=2510978 RepID=A0A4Q7J5F8_9PSEU|nr:DNA methyltransferase [Amycolatopsis suaedae]RZQ61986.1 site-specific DNA-methyltransferase [Amycolatopsis suaedae]